MKNAVAYKLGPALIRAINHKLKVTREEQQKREEIVERQKTKTIAARCQRTRGRISLLSKEKKNYESDSGDETDLNQAGDNKNPLQLWEKRGWRKLQAIT